MRVAIGMLSAAGGEEGADGHQPEHAACVLAIKCMRMLVRIRGYVSTSSYPALRTQHEHVDTAAAGRRVAFASRARRCDLHVHGRGV